MGSASRRASRSGSSRSSTGSIPLSRAASAAAASACSSRASSWPGWGAASRSGRNPARARRSSWICPPLSRISRRAANLEDAGSRRRRRPCGARGTRACPAAARLRGRAGVGRRHGADGRGHAHTRRRRTRRDDARARRSRRDAPPTQAGEPHPDPLAHGPRRDRRPGRGARRGRRRLPAEAVRPRGAPRAGARSPAPLEARGAGRGAPLRRPDPRSGLDGRTPRRPSLRADDDGGPPARAVHAEPPPGAAALAHLRARLGLRLQPLVERARRLRRLSPPQDGGGGRNASHPHRPRHGLRHARAVTLRARLSLVAAGVVAVVVALACATTYFVMRHELQAQLDSSLKKDVAAVQANPTAYTGPEDFGGNAVEVIDQSGHVRAASYSVTPDARVLAVAAGTRGGFFRDITARNPVGEVHLRELVVPVPGLFGPAGAIIAYKNLQETNRALERLRFILILVSLGGIVAAALAGAAVSGATLAPVRRLTAAAERIAETGEPSERVPEGGHDELGALGASFNTMLAALEEALATQRRFVADASHELRTPRTTPQTHIMAL